jgi:hypothetical protein
MAVTLAGLAGVGCSAMTPGNVHAVAPVSSAPRAGNAYILRGFIGVFSTGVDKMGEEINKNGVHASVFQDDQWSELAGSIRKKYRNAPAVEPLVLIGHSYGADDVVRIARKLNDDNIPVDLLLTLDPVTPPNIPPNVRRCVNLYQSNGMWDKLPWLRGVPVQSDKGARTQLANYNLRVDRTDLLEPGLDHFNIEKKQKIHEEVLRQVLASCPPRTEWARVRAGIEGVATSATEDIDAANAGATRASATMQPKHASWQPPTAVKSLSTQSKVPAPAKTSQTNNPSAAAGSRASANDPRTTSTPGVATGSGN